MFRAPSIPLFTHSPTFSVWAPHDRLTDNWPVHWTGRTRGMAGMIRADGKVWRWLGPDATAQGIEAVVTESVEILPTRTVVRCRAGSLSLKIEFISPLIADDLDLVSRPASYVVITVSGQAKDVSLYLDFSGEHCVNDEGQKVVMARHKVAGRDALSVRAAEQKPLNRSGDNITADWGALYVLPPVGAASAVASDSAARRLFAAQGQAVQTDDVRFPRAASDDWRVMSFVHRLGDVQGSASARFIAAYDEGDCLEYFRRALPAYWARAGKHAGTMLAEADEQAEKVAAQAAAFDAKVVASLADLGGDAYVRIGSLAYRQCLAAHQLAADPFDGLLHMSKECFSNGCIATVDVTFPASPFFLLFNPELLKAQIRPILRYAASDLWPYPYAPHDLGTYPKANGQVYGMGSPHDADRMPVEECGNMLIMMGALARTDGSAEFSRPYAGLVKEWSDYLMKEGLDPANQLCTDDFAGHLARNANLSLKAILGVRAAADLMEGLEMKDEAAKAKSWAKEAAGKWMVLAEAGKGPSLLAFGSPGTWSIKYNLLWDKLLGYGLFPQSLYEAEIDWLIKQNKEFGVPLDNRRTWTKGDWVAWAAAFAPTKEQFVALIEPLDAFIQKSPSRVPFSDWHDVVSGRQVGFQHRSVIGGVFARVLAASGKLSK